MVVDHYCRLPYAFTFLLKHGTNLFLQEGPFKKRCVGDKFWG